MRRPPGIPQAAFLAFWGHGATWAEQGPAGGGSAGVMNYRDACAIRARRGRGDVCPDGERRYHETVFEHQEPSGVHYARNGRAAPRLRLAIEADPRDSPAFTRLKAPTGGPAPGLAIASRGGDPPADL